MIETVFSRCPVGSVTELIMRNGRLQAALTRAGAAFRLLQEMDVRFQRTHFTQEEPLHFRDGGNIPPIWAQAQGERSVLLGLTFQHERQGLFVRPDSALHGPEDLRGARIAIPVREAEPVDFQKLTALCGVQQILSRVGLTPADIEPVYIPCAAYRIQQSKSLNVMKRDFDFMTEEFQAVAEGRADAAYANSVKVVRHMREGVFRNLLPAEAQFDENALNNNNPILITCTRRFAYEHPEIVTVYLRELIYAAEEAAANPEMFIDAVCAGIYEATPDELREAYMPDLTTIRRPRLDDEALAAVERRIAFLLDEKAIARAPSLTAWADAGFLRAAEAAASAGEGR